MSQLLTSTLGHVWFGGASAIGRLYDGAEHATAPTAEIFSTNNTIAIGGPAISNGTCATIRAAVVVVVMIVTPLCAPADETIVFFGTHSGELWALDALSTPITMRWRFSVYQNVTATAELDGASINLPVPPQEPEPDSIHILMVPAVDVRRARSLACSLSLALIDSWRLQSQSGLVYFSYLNVLVGLTPSTGKIAALYTFELPDGLALTGGLLISHQTQALFVVANPIDGRGSGDDVTPGIVRFDRKTGESSWLIDVPGHAGPLALSPAEDFLVSSSTDQHLYFVSIDTREVARVDTNGVVAGATLIDGNGLVYASSNDGFLYVFSLATLKLLTKWYSPGIGLQSSPVLGQAGWLYTSGFGILQVIRHGSCSTPHKPHTALFWLVVSVGSIFVAFGFLSLVIGVFFCLRQRRLRLKAQYRQIQDRAYDQDDDYDDEEHDNNRQVGDAQ